jgi:isochorismate hydrolase
VTPRRQALHARQWRDFASTFRRHHLKERVKMDLTLTPARTALVVIDMQRGVAAAATAPHPASDVVAHATR